MPFQYHFCCPDCFVFDDGFFGIMHHECIFKCDMTNLEKLLMTYWWCGSFCISEISFISFDEPIEQYPVCALSKEIARHVLI